MAPPRLARAFPPRARGQIVTPLLGAYLIDSAWFGMAWKLALLLVVVFWLALAFHVFRDARHRIADPWLVGTATLLALAVPFVGALVYMLFRPPEPLGDVRLREAELRLLEERLGKGAPACPVCRAGVEAEFLVCPVCTTRLRLPCGGCGAPLEALWQACPWCAAPVGAAVVAIDLDADDLDGALTAEAAGAASSAVLESRRADSNRGPLHYE